MQVGEGKVRSKRGKGKSKVFKVIWLIRSIRVFRKKKIKVTRIIMRGILVNGDT